VGFWESFKAGFYGAAGVDYYSMKNNEVLRDIRDSTSQTAPSQRNIHAAMYLGFLGTVAKPVDDAVMVELRHAMETNGLIAWAGRATPVIQRAAETVRASSAPDFETDAVRSLYLRAMDGYVNAAAWWITGDRENGDQWARQAAAAWESAIDAAADEFGGQPAAFPLTAPTTASTRDFQRRIAAAQERIDRAGRF